MKRAVLRQRSVHEIETRGTALRVVEPPVPIVEWLRPWSGVGEPARVPPVSANAEVRVKRFAAGGVAEDRYGAALLADDGSPLALLSALVEACRDIGELALPGGEDERVVLEVTLRR